MNIKALIADDDEFSASVLQRILASLGTTADIVPNGLMCCEQLEAHPNVYQVVFMDVLMPEMDGLEATTAIKTLGLGNVRKIIGMTGDSDSGVLARCREVGMDEILVKPLRIDRLRGILTDIV